MRPWVSPEKRTPGSSGPYSRQPAHGSRCLCGADDTECLCAGLPVQLERSDLRIVPLVVGKVEEVGRGLLLPCLPGENRTRQKESSWLSPLSGKGRSSCSPEKLTVRLPGILGAGVKCSHGEGPAPRPLLCWRRRTHAFLESLQAQSASPPHQSAAPSVKGVLSPRNSVLSQRNSEFG